MLKPAHRFMQLLARCSRHGGQLDSYPFTFIQVHMKCMGLCGFMNTICQSRGKIHTERIAITTSGSQLQRPRVEPMLINDSK